MKAVLPSILLLLGCYAGNLRAQAQQAPDDFVPDKPTEVTSAKIKYVLINPDEKAPVDVKADERNPFGQIVDELKVVGGTKGTTEENSIRTHLEKLKVVGASSGPKGPRVMLGDLVLEPGEKVPPVVADQTLNLSVNRITDHAIELVWLEKKATGMPPRLLTLPVDLRPYVRHALLGQASTEKDQDAKKKEKKGRSASLPMGTEFMQPDESNTGIVKLGDDTKPGSADITADATPAAKPSATPAAASKATATSSPAPSVTSTTSAPAPAASPVPAAPAQEPVEWKRAVGLLNNLAKLEEAKN